MDTVKANRVTMFKTVDAYLDQNNSIWNGMAPFVTAAQALKGKISEIDAAAQKQETPSGATADKAAARDALEDVLFLMCQALSVRECELSLRRCEMCLRSREIALRSREFGFRSR